jgi:hypothetical protein
VIGMARKPGTSRQTNQPAKTAPEASLPLDASALSIVAGLEGHDLNGLRRQWRAHLDGEPPVHLPRWLLMRVLAYRMQADAFGGLDKSIQRTLRSDKHQGAAMPFDRRAPQTRDGVGLKVGALPRRCNVGRRAMKDRSGKGILRCAIYTRVSTDQGLEQDFDSLDAQLLKRHYPTNFLAVVGRGSFRPSGSFVDLPMARPGQWRTLGLDASARA